MDTSQTELAEKKLRELYITKLQLLKEREKYIEDNKLEFFTRPNPAQAKLLEAWMDPTYKVFAFTGANRIGKTTIAVIVALSTLFGKWLWNNQPLPIINQKYPRRVRFVGQGWETHIKAVVEPKLKEYWPKKRPLETRKNNIGADYIWKDVLTGSTLEIMSNSQESDVFEGWAGDLVVYDEPPRRDIRVACARGLIDRHGRELFCATLLKEAWLHREVIKAITPDGKADPTVFSINSDISVNIGYGLTQEGVDQFSKTLKDEERESRLLGRPSYMATLVCPRFNRNIHVRDRMEKIPLDWIVDVSIDFHPSKPWAVVFMATARNGFKYIIDEIKMKGNPESVVDEIVRKMKQGNYRPGRIIIDPLAKGGEGNDIDVYSAMANRFSSYKLLLETASKDKEVGISILNSLLWTENEMPGCFFFRDCINTITEIENWMYDPETLKPSKESDDFCECLYRLALLNTTWFPPEDIQVSKQHNMVL